MSTLAIHTNQISKMFHIGAAQPRYKTLRESLMQALQRKNKEADRVIWALKDVTIDIEQGEAVGLIGRNGSGKSTLLKILSRITEPTIGTADIYGRVGSLLEVGTGFHPELTGRENIYLNGSILGMRRYEVERQFDEIVDFAEIEKFLDTPVKHYSSGMYLRLAFAVAAHLQTEILLVDEVLAVGDAAFQKKCLGKMSTVTQTGRTVFFVSHNMAAVQSLCERAIWLDEGQVKATGSVNEVTTRYVSESLTNQTMKIWEDIASAPGSETVRLHQVRVRSADGTPSDHLNIRTPLALECEYWNLKPGNVLNLSIHVYNEDGILVFNTFPVHEPNWFRKPHPKGLFRSTVYIPGDLLNSGIHRVTILIVRDQSAVLSRHEDILIFDLLDNIERRPDWHGKWIGAIRPDLTWETHLIKSDD